MTDVMQGNISQRKENCSTKYIPRPINFAAVVCLQVEQGDGGDGHHEFASARRPYIINPNLHHEVSS
jgi:hypothetical protein